MKLVMRLLTFAILATSIGAMPAHARGDRGGGHFKKMIEDLNLTAEQKTKAKKIHGEGHDAIKAKKDAMKAAHDELEKAIKGTATDEEIRAKFAALQKTQEEFSKARFEKVLALRAILTPEQRSKLKSPQGMRKGGGHGHGPDHEGDEE